ncbi:MAG TPA: DHA2 family efflux MFS transporter permease subunit [Candidatus Hydrogenedentes bacterium]|nr:DHA2 family efflux MFS transporter permease subunit [Candidatus Hydrogenedentota bacterium]
MTESVAANGTAAPEHQEWHAPYNPWLIAFVTTLATFMEVLDTTIVNVALPHIAGNLGADVNDSTWVLTSYLVSNAVVLPLSAWCASLFGRRNFYLVCVALFTFSSFLCGFAPTLGMLVFFRLLQGVGGGGLQPISQAIMVDTFPPKQRGMSMALFGITVVVAPIIGPTLGGWITDNFSWRWIFFINIPVGLVSLALAPRLITDPPYVKRRTGPDRFKTDYIGLGLLCLGLGSLQLVLDLGERYDWFGSRFITLVTVIAVTATISAVIWELRHKDPILDFKLLGERNLGAATLVMLLFGATLYGSTVLMTLFMQVLLGYTSLWSGLALSPGAVVTLLMLPFVGILVSRIDARPMIAFGMIIIAFSFLYMGHFSLGIDFRTAVSARMVQAFGLAFIFVPLNTIAYMYVPREARNSASSLINVARNVGGSLGIALSTTLVSRFSQVHQTHLVAHLTPYDPGYQATLQNTARLIAPYAGDPVQAAAQAQGAIYGIVRQQAATLAFVDCFRLMAILAAIVIPLVIFMRKAPPTTDSTPMH